MRALPSRRMRAARVSSACCSAAANATRLRQQFLDAACIIAERRSAIRTAAPARGSGFSFCGALFFATLLTNTPAQVGDWWGTPNPALTDPGLDDVCHARRG